MSCDRQNKPDQTELTHLPASAQSILPLQNPPPKFDSTDFLPACLAVGLHPHWNLEIERE